MSNTTPTSAPTGQNANQRVAPLLAAIDLRDYFAAKALQGICAAPEHLDRIGSFKNAAATAYELADAMLAARD